jgi:pilus assembly protein Flp/PilA
MLNFIEAYFISTFGARKDDERGASAVEYGLLVAAIAAVIVLAVFALGGMVSEMFTETCKDVATGSELTATCEPTT